MMKKIYDLIWTIYSLLLAPVLVITFSLFYLYRCIIQCLLKIEYKDKFVGLLTGEDTIWAIEEPTALSVSNILMILEKDARHSNINFLETFRNLVKERIVKSQYEKLLYKRRKKFGYFFWERNDEIDLENRVRWLEYERTSCDGSCDNIYNGHLKRILRNVCNQPLPEDHTASWEILIGKSCPRSSYHYLRRMEERLKYGKIRIPILFRVHHSLADGNSLLKLFLDVIADKHITQVTLPAIGNLSIKMRNGEDFDTITVTVPQIHRSDTYLHISNRSTTYSYQKDLLNASMPFTYLTTFTTLADQIKTSLDIGLKYFENFTKEQFKREVVALLWSQWKEFRCFITNVHQKLKMILNVIDIVLFAPVFFMRQTLRSMQDISILHGPTLSGQKVISYWMEDDLRKFEDQRLLTKIQNIKYITGATFSDVLLAALSASLHKCFLKFDSAVPDKLTVIVPRKISDSADACILQNNFSIGLLPLCISNINGELVLDPGEDSKILDRLQDIKKANDQLKTGNDYAVNFLVMKYLSALLPEDLLRPLLESHSTMIFSQLPGPQELQILGHSLKNMVFWMPNRSYTGIGCGMITYRGYLHLSLVADKNLVEDEKILTDILENTVHEIDDLYDRLTLSSFSKRFQNNATPMKTGIGVL